MPIFHPFGIPSTSSFAVSSSVSEILKVNPATPGVPYALSAESGPQGVVGTPSVTCPSGYFDASVYSVVGGITFAPVPTKSRDYRLCYQIPTPTPTPTSTTSVTPSVSITVTVTRTVTPTVTPTITSTMTPSVTVTRTITPTVTPSITQTVTPSVTVTRTITPTNTPSITTTNTPTVTPSITRTQTITPTNTPSATIPPTPSVTPTVTPTNPPSVTPTPSITPTNTITPTRTVTPTVSVTPTRSVEPTPSPTPSAQFLHYCACFATGYDCQLYNKAGGCDAVATDVYAAPGTCHPCTLNVPSPTVTPTRTMTVTPSQAPPAKFIITGTSTQTAGGSQTITITAKDIYNNTVAFYNGAKTLTFSGAVAAPDGTTPKVDDVAFGTGTSVTFTNGVATATLKLYKTETATIAVTGDGLSATGTDRLIVTVSDAGGNNFVFSGTSTQTAGTSQNITITARDAYNNPATSYTGAQSLTFSGPSNSGAGNVPTFAGTNRGTATSITFSSGVASSVAMILYAVETATISATASGVTTATSLSVTVSAASATNFVFSGDGSITAGNALSINITARDAYYNTATSYDGVKSLTFSGANASPSNATPKVNSVNFGTATSITFSSGVASSLNLQLFKVETATISAATSGVTTATPLSVTVAHAATHNFVLSGGSSSQLAGDTRTTTIRARDAYHNTATSYTGTKTLIFSGASSAPNGTAPTAAGEGTAFGTGTRVIFTNGVASDVDIILYKVETAIIQVADGAISSTLGTAISITVSNSTATNFVITGTSTQIAGALQNITISARDAYYNSATSYTGAQSLTFSGPSNAPSGTVPTFNGTNRGSTTSVTFTTGVAIVAMILYAAETATVSATASGITTATSLSVTVTSAMVNYITLAYSSGGTSSGNMQAGGAAHSGQQDYFVLVTAKDVYGNTCSSGINNINGYYSIKWGGANESPGNNGSAVATQPRVGDNDGNFSTTFTSYSGRDFTNGTCIYKLRLYKAETANLTAQLYTYPSNTLLASQNATHAVTVVAGPVGAGQGAIKANSVTTQTPDVNTNAISPSVRITDDYGNVVSGAQVGFTRQLGSANVTAGAGQTQVNVNYVVGTTDSNGIVTLGTWGAMPTTSATSATDYTQRVIVQSDLNPAANSILFYAAPKPKAPVRLLLANYVNGEPNVPVTAGTEFTFRVFFVDTHDNTCAWGDNATIVQNSTTKSLVSSYIDIFFAGAGNAPDGSVPEVYAGSPLTWVKFMGNTGSGGAGRTIANGYFDYPMKLYKVENFYVTASIAWVGSSPSGLQGTHSMYVDPNTTDTTDSSLSIGSTSLVEGNTTTLTLYTKDTYQNLRSDSETTVTTGAGSLSSKTTVQLGQYTWTYTAPTVTSADVDSGTSQKTYSNTITAKIGSTNINGSPITIISKDTSGTSYGEFCSQQVPDGVPAAKYEKFADGVGDFYYSLISYNHPDCCAEIGNIPCGSGCCGGICENGSCIS